MACCRRGALLCLLASCGLVCWCASLLVVRGLLVWRALVGCVPWVFRGCLSLRLMCSPRHVGLLVAPAVPPGGSPMGLVCVGGGLVS